MKKEDKKSFGLEIIGIILSVCSLMIVYYLFYDFFFEHHYWVNRIKLYKMLKNGDRYIVSKRAVFNDIDEYKLSNGASIWYWHYINKISYNENGYAYVGLFRFSQ